MSDSSYSLITRNYFGNFPWKITNIDMGNALVTINTYRCIVSPKDRSVTHKVFSESVTMKIWQFKLCPIYDQVMSVATADEIQLIDDGTPKFQKSKLSYPPINLEEINCRFWKVVEVDKDIGTVTLQAMDVATVKLTLSWADYWTRIPRKTRDYIEQNTDKDMKLLLVPLQLETRPQYVVEYDWLLQKYRNVVRQKLTKDKKATLLKPICESLRDSEYIFREILAKRCKLPGGVDPFWAFYNEMMNKALL